MKDHQNPELFQPSHTLSFGSSSDPDALPLTFLMTLAMQAASLNCSLLTGGNGLRHR